MFLHCISQQPLVALKCGWQNNQSSRRFPCWSSGFCRWRSSLMQLTCGEQKWLWWKPEHTKTVKCITSCLGGNKPQGVQCLKPSVFGAVNNKRRHFSFFYCTFVFRAYIFQRKLAVQLCAASFSVSANTVNRGSPEGCGAPGLEKAPIDSGISQGAQCLRSLAQVFFYSLFPHRQSQDDPDSTAERIWKLGQTHTPKRS